jgi:DNA-binding YbaB/EbfC family protein
LLEQERMLINRRARRILAAPLVRAAFEAFPGAEHQGRVGPRWITESKIMKSLDDIINMAQNVQNELQKAQANLDTIEVEGAAGGGMVKVRATAKGRIIAVDIDDSPVRRRAEKQMLEDLVVAAFNDARAKADAASNAEMGKMTSGLPLPPGCLKRCRLTERP